MLDSTRKLVKFRETVEQTSFTPPSPIKATPTTLASDSNDASTTSFSKTSDVMMTSSSKTKGILKKKSTLLNKDPSEGKTTAIAAVMKGRPKHGHHHQGSNKHYKQKLVRVLLDSGSDGNLVFIEYKKNNRPWYDLILGVKTMIRYGIILDFKDKMITVDEVKLPMQNINHLQGSSTLPVLKLNHSLAMEPQSTQEATKHVTQILDTKYQKADLQSIVNDKCKHLSANQQKKLNNK